MIIDNNKSNDNNTNSSSSPDTDQDKWVANLKDKWVANLRDRSLAPLSTHDSPPSYLDVENLSISSTGVSTSNRPFPNIKPSNFVSLSRANGSIKGSWLIDPTLFIPSSFLPPLRPSETETDRRNLYLDSKNGGIDADVYLPLTSHSDGNTSNFIVIHTQSSNGSVKTRLHEGKSSNGEVRLPIRLSTYSSNGSIHVQLPRSFRGPIRIRNTNGNTHISAAIQAHLTPFSEMDHVQRSFLGYFNPSQWEIGVPWEGDELSIESKNGSVNVSFDDEAAALSNQSFFARIFSL